MRSLVWGTAAGLVLAFLGLVLGFLDWGSPIVGLYSELTHFLGTPEVFNFIHDLLGEYSSFAKDLAMVGALILWTLLHALFLWAYLRLGAWTIAVPLAFYIYFGGWLTGLLYTALFWGFAAWIERDAPEPFDLERRRAVTAGALGAVTLVLGGLAAVVMRWMAPGGGGTVGGTDPRMPAAPTVWARVKRSGRILWARIRGLSSEITRQPDLYYVSKNPVAFDPDLAAADYRLEVGGLVESPYILTLEQLQALPSVDFTYTLNCISNPIGGDLIGNCVWTGVRVTELLARAGPLPEADWMVSRAADDYMESSPLPDLPEETMVAYAINGEPLFRKHGYPTRLLIPGLYGMKMPKWLTRLALSREQVLGYWARRGWTETAVVHTMSRIDTPREGEVLEAGTEYAVAGIAYAGGRGIEDVQVSTDGGETWRSAILKPPLSGYAWHLWSFSWRPERPGRYTLVVRAVEPGGIIQTAERNPPLPAGATGWHHVPVVVR